MSNTYMVLCWFASRGLQSNALSTSFTNRASGLGLVDQPPSFIFSETGLVESTCPTQVSAHCSHDHFILLIDIYFFIFISVPLNLERCRVSFRSIMRQRMEAQARPIRMMNAQATTSRFSFLVSSICAKRKWFCDIDWRRNFQPTYCITS